MSCAQKIMTCSHKKIKLCAQEKVSPFESLGLCSVHISKHYLPWTETHLVIHMSLES